jgi:hypothetical protein
LSPDHFLFKSFYSEEDKAVSMSYISARQFLNSIILNLHSEDPYNLKEITNNVKIIKEKKDSRTSKSSVMTISLPSDPLMVKASYCLYPDLNKIVVCVKIMNTSTIDMFQMKVELATEGPFILFDTNLQSIEIIGDFQPGTTHEFEREFILNKFKFSSIHVTIVCSASKKSIDADLLKNEQREDHGSMSIRCSPFVVKLFDFLVPLKRLLHEDFLILWET